MVSKVWFITGTSRGFGRAWTEAALRRGDKVAAAARDVQTLAALAAEYGSAVLPLALDVTQRDDVFSAIERAADHFGRLDVVTCNAGYGLFATVEETSEAAARRQFETNFFGALWTLQAALPIFRRQGAGHFLVVSSLAGVITFPTAGLYNASKWAVEGLCETLAKETEDFGIRTTLIEPGGYATDWRGSSAHHEPRMPAYDALRQKVASAYGGRALGAPEATAQAVLRCVDDESPPLRLLLGESALATVKKVYAERLAIWDAWADVSARV